MPCKVCDEITYPSPNFPGCTLDVFGIDKLFNSTHFNGCDQLSMPGFKLNNANKEAPGVLLSEDPRVIGSVERTSNCSIVEYPFGYWSLWCTCILKRKGCRGNCIIVSSSKTLKAVNLLWPNDPIRCHRYRQTLVQLMAWRLTGDTSLPDRMLYNC